MWLFCTDSVSFAGVQNSRASICKCFEISVYRDFYAARRSVDFLPLLFLPSLSLFDKFRILLVPLRRLFGHLSKLLPFAWRCSKVACLHSRWSIGEEFSSILPKGAQRSINLRISSRTCSFSPEPAPDSFFFMYGNVCGMEKWRRIQRYASVASIHLEIRVSRVTIISARTLARNAFFF